MMRPTELMTATVLKAMFAVLAAIGTVFAVAPYLNRDSFLTRYSPAGRVLFTVSLCLLSIIAGWLVFDEANTWRRAQRPTMLTDGTPARMFPPPVQSATPGRNQRMAQTDTALRDPTSATAQPRRQRITTNESTTARIRIQDDAGNLVPGLVLIAQRELPADVMVEGTLHTTTTPPDDALQGLITANATLTVTTKDVGRLLDTIDLNTRGGGFTAEAALSQARERLDAEFIKRLKEHP